MPGRDDDDALPGRAQVRDGGLEPTRARRREEQYVRGGAEDLLEALETAGVDGAEVGAAVVDDRLRERRQNLGRNRRRPGREEVALLGHALRVSARAVRVV